ncbi:MAG: L,D-transpeptidase family protein [Flavobacteriales bacterium]|nr:L,D-transpeptidase family protein [Bacteroidota bacterium]MCB9240070.1 L,D-transpeptidase family protein [Flavobacteriales bacterium]
MNPRSFILFLLTVLFPLQLISDDFRTQQRKYERVKNAFEEKEVDFKTQLALKGVDKENFEIYIRGFKMEETLELWARTKGKTTWVNIRSYPFCSSVGALGPKRQQGDFQIPEGFYTISEFNPSSDFHLSLKINYPNASDSILGKKGDYGDLIYIHGGCQTIGCIPISDDKIKELYVAAVLARSKGQTSIAVHLFPARLNYANYRALSERTADKSIVRFWGNIRTCYQYFEEFGEYPNITVNEDGRYLFKR